MRGLSATIGLFEGAAASRCLSFAAFLYLMLGGELSGLQTRRAK